jgi:hypothetical protein
MARLLVDTDVASFVFKWHPEFAPQYVAIMRGSELVVSLMTLAEMRQGALDANWDRASALHWKPIYLTSQHSIPTACCAPRGPSFETRARERDVELVQPTHGSLRRPWFCQYRW